VNLYSLLVQVKIPWPLYEATLEVSHIQYMCLMSRKYHVFNVPGWSVLPKHVAGVDGNKRNHLWLTARVYHFLIWRTKLNEATTSRRESLPQSSEHPEDDGSPKPMYLSTGTTRRHSPAHSNLQI